jgi:hypothetical protein
MDGIMAGSKYLEILQIPFDLAVPLKRYDILFKKCLQHGSLNLKELLFYVEIYIYT